MYLSISTSQRIDLREVKAARLPCGDIWLYAGNDVGRIYMDDEAARELVKQLTALLEPAKPELPLDDDGDEIDPRGYVFIDRMGFAWGWRDGMNGALATYAMRPFRTRKEAQAAADTFKSTHVTAAARTPQCRVKVWTHECGVAPMPEETP